MPEGTVKWFDAKKGFGFIEQEEGEDVLVHHHEIQSEGHMTLSEGDKVMLDIVVGYKGPIAVNVVKTS